MHRPARDVSAKLETVCLECNGQTVKIDPITRETVRRHLRERGPAYPVGAAISLSVTLSVLYRELGWSVSLLLASLIVLAITVVVCATYFVFFVLISKPRR